MPCWERWRSEISAASLPLGDPRKKNADSALFLNLALEEVRTAGYRIVNIDTTLVLGRRPKSARSPLDMRRRVAELLDIQPNAVGIKAKTPEGLNQDHVAQAHAVVLLEALDDNDGIGLLEAEVGGARGEGIPCCCREQQGGWAPPGARTPPLDLRCKDRAPFFNVASAHTTHTGGGGGGGPQAPTPFFFFFS